MATEDTSTATPGSETLNGTAPTGETPNTGTGETLGTTTEPSPADIRKENERLAAALKRANAEAKEHRIKAEELDKLKAAQMTEQEKKDKLLADLQSSLSAREKQLQDERNYNALERAGRRVGIHDETALADAIRLVDLSALEHDDQGKPKNADELMKELVKTRQWLIDKKAPALTGGGATSPARSQSSAPPVLSWEAIGKMKPEEYTARSAEIQQWIAANPIRFGQRH